jgi:hypothetical protein
VDVTRIEAAEGRLTVAWPAGEAVFELGPQAARWAERIRNPRTLADKLGVKEGLRVGVVGLEHELVAGHGPPQEGSDLIFLGVETLDDLVRVPELATLLAPAGGLWVVFPKGRKDVTQTDVLATGRAAALTDVKVAKFSETHTALKFVIPRDRR